VVTVFRSRRRAGSDAAYARLAEAMLTSAREVPGFVDFATFVGDDGDRVSRVTFATPEAQAAWREGGKKIPLAAFAGALQMLAGGPETIALTWLFIGGLWLQQWVAGEASRTRMIWRLSVVGRRGAAPRQTASGPPLRHGPRPANESRAPRTR